MASSRRRERQLARRRYERRQLAAQQHRQQVRHRTTIIGAVTGVVVVVLVLVLVGLAVFSSSSSSKKKSTAAASPSASPTSALAAAPTKCATISPDPAAAGEPTVPQVKGKAPTTLVKKNVKVGTGATAKTTDTVTVQYVGVSCSTGKVFDASYTDASLKTKGFTFTLGQGQVIKGWDEGIPGMKIGGYRELVIPASLAYGTTGYSDIKGNDTLIFLVHLLSIQA